jgi:hypothetical protein
MDIGNMLNTKGAKGAAALAAAAAANGEQQMSQHHLIPHHNNHSMSETASDRGTSPHGSEHSRYSAPGMNMNMGMPRYPSPTAMQGALPMMNYPPNHNFDGGMMQQENQRQPVRQPSGDIVAQKAFPCSSCGKGFARRSDLARHGMFARDHLILLIYINIWNREDSQRRTATCL